MEDAEKVIEVVAKMEPDVLPAVYSTLIIEYIRRRNVRKALSIFDTTLTKLRYNLNEYFDVLFELAVNDYENEFHRVRF
jgi:pentatricopeptide repeat protein